MINESLRPFIVPIDSLTPDPRNARRHPRESIDALKSSLDVFGQQKASVTFDSNRVIVTGNGLWLAAKELGWTEIAATPYQGDSEGIRRAFAVADNKTAEFSQWDYDSLKSTLTEIRDQDIGVLTATGFTDIEIGLLTNDFDELPPVKTKFGKKKPGSKAEGDDEAEFAPDVFVAFSGELYAGIQTKVEAKISELKLAGVDAIARAIVALIAGGTEEKDHV